MAAIDRLNPTQEHLRQFGEPEAGLATTLRPGAYAIVLDHDRILVIDDGCRFHLPGGGIEAGEDPLTALHREVREETGHELAGATPFQRAEQWVTADGTAVNKDCHFFLATLGDRATEPLATDGFARWAPKDAALDLMAEDASRWAVSVALCANAIVERLAT